MTEKSDAPAASYTLEIIECLANSPQMLGISDISRITEINKNAVSRVLKTLLENGWIYQDGLKYQLTLKPFCLTAKTLQRFDLYQAAQSVVRELWEKTGSSCYLGILKENKVLYILHYDSVHDLKIAGQLGGMYALHCSAPGKILLAYASEAYRNMYCDTMLVRNTENTITDKNKMLEHLCMVREKGYATDVEEYGRGIVCVAAPVFDRDGKAAAAVGISTSTVYRNEEQIISIEGEAVRSAAREISERLGFVK